VECAAILRAIHLGDLDQLILPEAPLDILAQQIVAACAADEWSEDDLFTLVRRARNYRDLSRQSFDKVLAMLSDGISAKRGRFGAYLYRDQVNHRLRARRGSRLAAITSGGAIPETALYNVVALPTETVIGTLDEDFAIESHAGDIMLLGNTSWRIHRIESRTGRVLVEDAHGQPPNIPFWRGEAPARTFELSTHVAHLRQLISDECDISLPTFPPEECHPEQSEGPQQVSNLDDRSKLSGHQSISQLSDAGIDPDSLRQLTTYIRDGRTVLGAVPTQQCVIAERLFDEGGGMQLVIHAPFGARINRAWGLALRKRFCRSFNFELQASATDDGINIALAEQHSFPLADVFHFLQPETVEDILQQAVLTGSPIFATRFRWDANRSLALLRFQNGKKVPPPIQRMRSDDLLAAVFPDVAACFENIQGDIQIPDHPLVEEVMKDVMHEAMDIDGLRRVLQSIRDGSIQTIAVDTPVPSQFAHEILNANPYAFLDDAPLEERRARAVQLRRTLPASVLEEAGQLDPAAIAQVVEESRPDLRDPDDLHDLLQTLIIFPVNVVPHICPPLADVGGADGRVPHLSVAPFDAKVGSNLPASHDFDLKCHPERSEGPLRHSDLALRFGLSGQQSISPSSISTHVDISSGRVAHICLPLANVGTSELPDLTRWMHHLVETRRAVFAFVDDREFWVASEKANAFTSIYVDVSFSPEPPDLHSSISAPDTILDRALLGWMQHLGPVTTQELSNLFSVNSSANPSQISATIAEPVTSASETIAHNANPSLISPAAINVSLLRLEATGAILRGHFRLSASGRQRSVTREDAPDLEWCDRRLLARIHHLTVATLRKQIEPVTAAQFMHWLLRWQHLAPGSTLRGEHGLQEALRQLQGFEIPASAWERHILARRVAAYDPSALDHLCLSGVAGWGRLSPHPATLEASIRDRRAVSEPVPDAAERIRRIVPTSVAPITFFLREDCAWMQSRPLDTSAECEFSASARLVLSTLRRRGASFFAELQRITALDRLEVERGLWELVAAGFVTADAFDNLRGLISKARPAAVSSRAQRPRHTAGRWSLLCLAEDIAGDAADGVTGEYADKPNEFAPSRTPSNSRAEATCWMLLARYGIVFRELLARETNLPRWRALQWAFRRLEAQGQIRGGRFVSGFVGEQFALPVAVESLRELRNLPASNELITISAADPLNLVGILVPGERISAIGPRSVSFRAGVYVPDTGAPAPLQSPDSVADDSSGCEAAV
ncbi:MAG: hypothetical protein WA532_12250, partial [Candidatus Korobacteraceae bacterium]